MSGHTLKRCRACGAECAPEDFGNTEMIPVPCVIWICSNAKMRGGDCPDETGYLTEEAWNERPIERELLEALERIRDHYTDTDLAAKHMAAIAEAVIAKAQEKSDGA